MRPRSKSNAYFHSFHFIFNSLYRVKSAGDKITALQLALSTKEREYLTKPIYNFMSQLTYENDKSEAGGFPNFYCFQGCQNGPGSPHFFSQNYKKVYNH